MQPKNKDVQPQYQDLIKLLYTYQHFPHKQIFENIKYLWDILPKIQKYLHKYFINNKPYQLHKSVGDVWIDQNVQIGKGTIIQHGSMIKGPCIIGQNCELRKGSYVRGNVIIGNGCIIGNSCEIKNSILLNDCQVPHFNYVGDSVLGTKSHIAAGVITSNLKLDSKSIKIKIGSTLIDTNLKKIGAFIGDNCQIGCNCVLNPGTIIGKNSTIYPGINLRQYIPPNSICKLKQTIEVVKKQPRQKL